jgi:hypothetical protein
MSKSGAVWSRKGEDRTGTVRSRRLGRREGKLLDVSRCFHARRWWGKLLDVSKRVAAAGRVAEGV